MSFGSHRVIVSSTDHEDNDRVYRCAASVTAGVILERWTKDVDLPLDAVQLRRPDGAIFRPQEALFRPGTSEKMAEVVAELCWRLRVALRSGEEHQITASPVATPRELLTSLRVAFALSDCRPLRLLLGGVALRPDIGLAAQGVSQGPQAPQLILELGFAGHVIEAKAGIARPFLLFASEPAARLTEPWLPQECRLFTRGRSEVGPAMAVALEGDVGDALGRLEDPEALRMDLEVRQGVAVFVSGHPRPQVVPAWAATAVGSLLNVLEPPPVAPPQPTLLEGALVRHSTAVHAVEGTMLAAESIPLKLWLKRRCRVLRLPCHSTVADLRAAATAALGLPENGEQKATLRVKKGRLVENEEDPRPLATFCVEHGDSYSADKPPTTPQSSRPQLSVSLSGGRTFDFSLAPGEVLRFGDVVSRLAAATGKPRADFRFRVFRCCGCGRGLEVEEEAFQTVPAPCCRKRSLKLTERRFANASTQGGQAVTKKCERATNTTRDEDRMKDASVSARPESADKKVGGRPVKAAKDSATQTKETEFGQSRKPQKPQPERPNPRLDKSKQLPEEHIPLVVPPFLKRDDQYVPMDIFGSVLPPLTPEQLQEIEAVKERRRQREARREMQMQQQKQQQLELDQLMAQHPSLPQPTAQHREALKEQLGQQQRVERPLDDRKRSDFLKRLKEEQEAAERRRQAMKRADDDGEEDQASQTPSQRPPSELIQKNRLQRTDEGQRRMPQFIKKYKNPEGGLQPRHGFPEYFGRGQLRKDESRQERRQRKLQELREKFDADRGAVAAQPAGISSWTHTNIMEPQQFLFKNIIPDPRSESSFRAFEIISLIRGRPDFSCQLHLPANPPVGVVRRELGLEMEVPPHRLRLRRSSLQLDGQRYFRVSNRPKDASNVRLYGAPDGNTFAVDTKTPSEVKFLENDSEPFPLVPGQTCVLEVSVQR